MSKLHLGKGSQLPKLPEDGKLRLYSMRFCPYAQRAHLVLDAKNIPYHTININLKQKPEWLTQKSPLGKVPALEIPSAKGDPLIESLIIADYLDEQYPQNPLNSKDPLQRARDRILIERFSAASPLLYKLIMVNGTPDELSSAFNDLWNSLDIFEAELKKRGTKFFSGPNPGFVDYMIWPWIERTKALPLALGDKYEKPEKDRYIKFHEWQSAMEQDPAVKVSIISGENHYKFIQSMQTDAPIYDSLA